MDLSDLVTVRARYSYPDNSFFCFFYKFIISENLYTLIQSLLYTKR